MSEGWAIPVLTIVYTGAAAAIAMKLCWVRVPKAVSAAIGIGLGWVGVVAFTQLAKVGFGGITLVVAGGVLYTAGALIYALKRPDPKPAVLGYHELFHLCTLGAAACQYIAIAFFVLPRA
jgi:hemolysin III